jgi:hypothetical protein
MANINGYVNPRSLGNDEPNQALTQDIFFEQVLWDKYIASKKTATQNLRTWDATVAVMMRLSGLSRAGALTQEQMHQGVPLGPIKIGSHAPCKLRVYEHPRIMALCVGLAA